MVEKISETGDNISGFKNVAIEIVNQREQGTKSTFTPNIFQNRHRARLDKANFELMQINEFYCIVYKFMKKQVMKIQFSSVATYKLT